MDDRSNFRTSEPEETVRPVAARPVAHVPHSLPEAHKSAKEEPSVKHKHIRKPAAPKKGWLKYLIALIIIGLIAWLAYGYITTKNQLESAKNASGPAQGETQQLVNEVGKLVQLPQGETPTIATVNNATKLQNQAFFKDAQNGDKVLIYSKSGKAVLYRPSTNKVIEYSTVNLTGT